MLTTETINNLLGIKESYQASDALMKILFDRKNREKLFKSFLRIEWHLDHDWFHIYFEEEHANKKKFAQDFTPDSISKLLSLLVNQDSNKSSGTRFDTAAGTGSLIIQKWYSDCVKESPFSYRPSKYLYHCEELSDRALPFLLFNLSIRGMNAIVVHGDALSREAKQVYFLQNDNDDPFQFSSINVMPHNPTVEKEFDIRKWVDPPVNHIESPKIQIDKKEGQLSLF